MKDSTKWLVLEDDECIHVVPATDIKPHGFPKNYVADLANTNCPCKPEIDFSGWKPTVVHNSFEDAERIDVAMQKILPAN